jgi:hypothetical protein
MEDLALPCLYGGLFRTPHSEIRIQESPSENPFPWQAPEGWGRVIA